MVIGLLASRRARALVGVDIFVRRRDPDRATAILRQLNACLKPGGRLLIAEPRMHVSAAAFAHELTLAAGVGFTLRDQPRVRRSRAAVSGLSAP